MNETKPLRRHPRRGGGLALAPSALVVLLVACSASGAAPSPAGSGSGLAADTGGSVAASVVAGSAVAGGASGAFENSCGTGGGSPAAAAGGSPAAAAGGSAAVPAGVGQYPGWPSEGTPPIIPILASTDLSVGPSRFLFNLVDQQNALVAAPDVTVDLGFYDLAHDPTTPQVRVPATFLPTVDKQGLYRAHVSFSCSGDWGVEIVAHKTGAPDRSVRAVFQVAATSTTPAIGQPIPQVDVPTATTPAAIAAISTDRNPDPAFYRVSEKQALAEHKPFLMILATPAFCQSRLCGPTLDIVKQVAKPYEGRMAFLHVEPYRLKQTSVGLQPVLDSRGSLQSVPAVDQLGLQFEPFVFVVDANGKVRAKFEGVVGRDELEAALKAVAG